ncbi:hypothetical protein NQ318_000999 [Aromia moschata]|uniref:Uncharacterized protein n=1 Tax=Aromia moschata TaxID=1265417 RepID=A0AAV8ZDY6_9CUCU|nr:hypothetical protein NQ318_000999 [Aromia moschata]
MFFQQDGCPAHHAVTAHNWLNSEFNEHWIGRDGPILWPPRSPDLTILDFYLWGRLKQIVYREPLENDEEQLKTRIQNAVKSLLACCFYLRLTVTKTGLFLHPFIYFNIHLMLVLGDATEVFLIGYDFETEKTGPIKQEKESRQREEGNRNSYWRHLDVLVAKLNDLATLQLLLVRQTNFAVLSSHSGKLSGLGVI